MKDSPCCIGQRLKKRLRESQRCTEQDQSLPGSAEENLADGSPFCSNQVSGNRRLDLNSRDLDMRNQGDFIDQSSRPAWESSARVPAFASVNPTCLQKGTGRNKSDRDADILFSRDVVALQLHCHHSGPSVQLAKTYPSTGAEVECESVDNHLNPMVRGFALLMSPCPDRDHDLQWLGPFVAD